MYLDFIREKYYNKLDFLFENKILNEFSLTHMKKRDITVYDVKKDFGCYHLSEKIPYVVIGASKDYVEKMNIPYQATSFIAGEVFSPNSGIFAFKFLEKRGGGVTLLTGGDRKIGDNLFASLHRLIIGKNAIIVTINNMMENFNQIWSWDFFGKNLKQYPQLYEDLLRISKKFLDLDNFYFIVSIRSFESIAETGFLDYYKKNKIAMLDSKNNIKVIIITTLKIYEYLSAFIKSDLVSYVVTGDDFDAYRGLEILRKEYNIQYLLNDGGRKMSISMRDDGLLSEERVTLEPYNPVTLDQKIDDSCILGRRNSGLDNSELEYSILLDSIPIGDEKANVYVYPLNDTKNI